MRVIRNLLGASLVALCAARCGATIVPISEFQGDLWEGFERIQPPNLYPTLPTFQGHATMSNEFIYFPNVLIATSLTYIPTNTQVLPYNGNLFGTIPVGTTLFTFDEPMAQFGGYMTSDVDSSVVVTFFDDAGDPVGSVSPSFVTGEWGWFGWSSDVPFTSVSIADNNPGAPEDTFPGDPVTFDDMQALTFAAVPEPGFAAVGAGAAGLAAGLLGRRHRRNG